MEKLTIIGKVKMQSKLAIAVRVMLNTTSPFERCVKKFDVTPIGDADNRINPTEISGERLNNFAIPKQEAGKKTIWQNNPINTALGYITTL